MANENSCVTEKINFIKSPSADGIKSPIAAEHVYEAEYDGCIIGHFHLHFDAEVPCSAELTYTLTSQVGHDLAGSILMAFFDMAAHMSSTLEKMIAYISAEDQIGMKVAYTSGFQHAGVPCIRRRDHRIHVFSKDVHVQKPNITHEGYWHEHLGKNELPVLEMPLDSLRPATQTREADYVQVQLPGLEQIEGLAHRFSSLLALWGLLLCRHSGQEGVMVGVKIRDRFVAPVLVKVARNMFADQLVMDVDRQVANAHAYGRQHLSSIVEHNWLPHAMPDASRHPVFQSMFTWTTRGDVQERSTFGTCDVGLTCCGTG